jgi:hypothetical protein
MNAKATWKEYSLAGGVSDDTTSVATDAFKDEVDRQLAGGTPSRARAACPAMPMRAALPGAAGVTSTRVI